DLGGVSVSVGRYGFEPGNEKWAGKTILGVRPEHVVVGEGASQQPFSFHAVIEIVEPMRSDTIASTKIVSHAFTFRADAELNLAEGQTVRLGFDAARASLFDAESGMRI